MEGYLVLSTEKFDFVEETHARKRIHTYLSTTCTRKRTHIYKKYT